jgi:hypothetical protein
VPSVRVRDHGCGRIGSKGAFPAGPTHARFAQFGPRWVQAGQSGPKRARTTANAPAPRRDNGALVVRRMDGNGRGSSGLRFRNGFRRSVGAPVFRRVAAQPTQEERGLCHSLHDWERILIDLLSIRYKRRSTCSRPKKFRRHCELSARFGHQSAQTSQRCGARLRHPALAASRRPFLLLVYPFTYVYM